jgi:hypothetical protein
MLNVLRTEAGFVGPAYPASRRSNDGNIAEAD